MALRPDPPMSMAMVMGPGVVDLTLGEAPDEGVVVEAVLGVISRIVLRAGGIARAESKDAPSKALGLGGISYTDA
jgi:hypothetical protein